MEIIDSVNLNQKFIFKRIRNIEINDFSRMINKDDNNTEIGYQCEVEPNDEKIEYGEEYRFYDLKVN